MNPIDDVKRYYLHKDDYSKLHFEVYDAQPYFLKYLRETTRAHRHAYFQLIWFTSVGRHYVDYQAIDHPANALFCINTNQIHYFDKDSLNEGFLFHVNDHFLDQFNQQFTQRFSFSIFHEMGVPFITLPDQDRRRFKYLLHFIREELKRADRWVRESVFTLFTHLLILVERLKADESGKTETTADFRLAYDFKKAVMENLSTFKSIRQYSDQLNTNEKKLTAISKTYLGGTPAEVIQSLKILEAKRRLANQHYSIQQVAYDLGFDQPTYFTKYFKKATGVTPKEFQTRLL